jgi:hypothetical protein
MSNVPNQIIAIPTNPVPAWTMASPAAGARYFKKAKPLEHETKGDDRDARVQPRKKRPLVSQVFSKIRLQDLSDTAKSKRRQGNEKMCQTPL